MEAGNYSLATDDVLNEGEQIIGVYGQLKDSSIGSLSFLVWKLNII
jgi:hypothetical protein